jgi:outer membrane protein
MLPMNIFFSNHTSDKMNYLLKSIPLLFIVASSFTAGAQNVYNLDLESSILLAKSRNNRMLILQESLNRAAYDLKAATSSLRTHVNMHISLPQYTETIRQWEDSLGISFYPVRQNLLSSHLVINQPLPTDGSLYIRSGVQNLVDYYVDNRLAQITSSIGLRQPLSALYGYNSIRSAHKQAELAYEQSLKQLKREELNLVYEVSLTFYTLLSYFESLNIARLSLERQQEAYDIAQSKFIAGLIREVESLQMEVDLGEALNNHDMAQFNYNSQQSLFKEYLGIDLRDSVALQSDLTYVPVFVDVEKALEMALENRPELRENEIQIEIQEMEIRRRKAAGRINGDILFNYNFIGVNKTNLAIPLQTAYGNTWQNLLDRPGSFGIGLTVSIPILDWGENRARVQSSEALLSQFTHVMEGNRVSIERDLRTTVDRLHNSLKRIQLLEKNVLVAEKSFEISRDRYASGDIDSQAMALERERLNTAYISRLESFITYKLMLSDLMRKTFYDFEKDMSVLGL